MIRGHRILVNPPRGGVDVFIAELDVQPDLIPFSWYHHTRAAFGMDGAAIPNVWKVGLRNRIDHSPYVVCGDTTIVSHETWQGWHRARMPYPSVRLPSEFRSFSGPTSEHLSHNPDISAPLLPGRRGECV